MMMQALQIKNLALSDIEEKFGLKLAEDDQFFSQWLGDLPQLSNGEKQSLDRVKDNYFNLAKYRPLPENLVKMVVLSPLLDLAGFYRSPFRVETETSVQISAEDEAEIVQGRIDVLVLQSRLWVLVVESKHSQFSIGMAIPQALAYMLASPNPEKSSFGLVMNGTNFRFMQLIKQDTLIYTLSDEFILDRGNDLHSVLSMLKQLGQILTQE